MLTFLALAHHAPKVIAPIAHAVTYALAQDETRSTETPVLARTPLPAVKMQNAMTGQVATEAKPSTLDKVWMQTPNAITLTGYALGLWWSIGGPTWAAIVSILADELDGRMARAMNATSELGSNLDWAGDVALVPMSLLRFGRATNLGAVPLLAAPPILYGQTKFRSDGHKTPVGSPRAVIMIATMLVEGVGSLRRVKV